MRFQTSGGEIIHVKVGISGVSAEGALNNLEKEIPGWDFDEVRRSAHEAWSRALSKIAVETPDLDAKRTFYSSLYHSLVAPTLFDDVDGRYRGMDGQIHRAARRDAQLQHVLPVGHLPRGASALHHDAAGARAGPGELPDPHGQ